METILHTLPISINESLINQGLRFDELDLSTNGWFDLWSVFVVSSCLYRKTKWATSVKAVSCLDAPVADTGKAFCCPERLDFFFRSYRWLDLSPVHPIYLPL